ncbi:MAG: flagellar motor switch protein FliG [Alphaproteobacteria bacterium HGW-Alphaproteobacteria-2]|nr:MAG: flagellar motor switch protein FliG [Alphaproteobacteria bacterium HGW-Alphaproteobacteria-2]
MHPLPSPHPASANAAAPAAALSPQQKAAVLVRLLLRGGAVPALARLSPAEQAALAQAMAQLHRVDRETLRSVIREFLAALEATGVILPGGIEGAMALLDGQISAQAVAQLRGSGAAPAADPWAEIAARPPEVLAARLAGEHPAIAAAALSRLPTALAAAVLAALPAPQARAVALVIPATEKTPPEVVTRIGAALAARDVDGAPRAFADDAATRFGAILDRTPQETRETLLSGLDREAASFAGAVRRRIFTFAHLPHRLELRDVPRAVRAAAPAVLLPALIHGRVNAPEATEFLLANMSKRLAEQTRGEMAEHPPVAPAAGEAAQADFVAAVRALDAAGEIALIPPEEDPES